MLFDFPEDDASRNALPIPRRETVIQAVQKFEEIATKPESPVRAIRTVAGGGTYIDPSVAGALVDGLLDAETGPGPASHVALSAREREVLVRIARGFSNKEIAGALKLSVKTVETYKARMAEKLGLRSRVDIVRYAAGQGWLGEPPPISSV